MTGLELWQLRVSARTRWQVVRLTDGDGGHGGGAVGLGEYSDAGPGAAALWAEIAARLADGASVREVLAELDGDSWALEPGALAGMGVDGGARRVSADVGGPADRLTRATVRGALECAAADLAARRAGEPLWRRLGAPGPRPVRRYANLNRALRLRTPEEFAEVAAAALAAGYTALKCAPFDGLGSEDLLAAGLERARAVRRAAPAAELMVDLHHLLTVDQILAIGRQLRALDLRWLEDTAALDDPDGLAAVHAARIAPLAGGEFARTPGEVRTPLRAGRLAWLLPDVKHAGGLAAAARLAEEALAAGAGVSLHNPAGPVATAAGLHLAAALGPLVETEFAFGEAPWRPRAVRPAESGDGPWLLPAEGPGLGLDLDPARWTAVPVPRAEGVRQ